MSQQLSTSSSCSSSSRCSAAAWARLLVPRRFRLGVILLHAACAPSGCGSNLQQQLAQISNHSQLFEEFIFISFGTLVNPNSCAPAKAFPNFLVSFFFSIFVYFFIDSLPQRCLGQLFLRVGFIFVLTLAPSRNYWRRFPILGISMHTN